MGSILVVAQVGAHNIRTLLSSGKEDALRDIKYATYGTAGQFGKALAKAPFLEALRFIDKEKTAQLVESLLQNADDLDYLQSLMTSVGKQPSINPTMNAVAEAFARRRVTGRFKTGAQSVALDTMLQLSTKGDTDDDGMMPHSASRQTPKQTKSSGICFRFQRNACTFRPCIYRHRCSICYSYAHGSTTCNRFQPPQNSSSPRPERSSNTMNQQRTTRPPHPRFRRDRATNRDVL